MRSEKTEEWANEQFDTHIAFLFPSFPLYDLSAALFVSYIFAFPDVTLPVVCVCVCARVCFRPNIVN